MLDAFDGREDTSFSFSPESSLLGPARSNIDHIDSKGEHASHGVPTVGDGIGFEEAWDVFIPLIGFDGDMFLQERSWLGGGKATFGVAIAYR